MTNRHGGLDILFSSLERQTYPFTFCIADELEFQRADVYIKHQKDDNIIFVENTKQEGNIRALAQAYNNAADLAVMLKYDLFITLQDYIWIADNGIEMFVEVHKTYPNSLITGLVSLSDAPSDDDIENPCGMYSIFKEPLIGRPEGISWHDPRGTNLYPGEPEIQSCAADHWEANWAAVPVSVLKKGVRWDTEYDKGVAYENIDFAKKAEQELGTSTILDKRNLAIGIPHREIWPAEQKQLERHTNRWLHEEKWGTLE